MRVIGGIHRSRLLQEVPSKDTRETKDRIKEAIFNSIAPSLYEANVLDLFAGSGSLGIEAISRGAAHATFVDHLAVAIDVVNENLKSLRIRSQATVRELDYGLFLDTTEDTYDVIFLDPPYDMDVIDELVQTIADRELLTEDGIIVCLYGKNTVLSESNNGIIEYKKKTYGITSVSYLKWGV